MNIDDFTVVGGYVYLKSLRIIILNNYKDLILVQKNLNIIFQFWLQLY